MTSPRSANRPARWLAPRSPARTGTSCSGIQRTTVDLRRTGECPAPLVPLRRPRPRGLRTRVSCSTPSGGHRRRCTRRRTGFGRTVPWTGWSRGCRAYRSRRYRTKASRTPRVHRRPATRPDIWPSRTRHHRLRSARTSTGPRPRAVPPDRSAASRCNNRRTRHSGRHTGSLAICRSCPRPSPWPPSSGRRPNNWTVDIT